MGLIVIIQSIKLVYYAGKLAKEHLVLICSQELKLAKQEWNPHFLEPLLVLSIMFLNLSYFLQYFADNAKYSQYLLTMQSMIDSLI